MAKEYTEDERKHLEFVQEIITRMNRCSFQLKQWMVTLVAAILGLSISVAKSELVLVSLFPILIFWLLDGYYLHQERKYRKLYQMIIQGFDQNRIYNLNASNYLPGFCEYIKVVFSQTIWPLYISTCILIISVFLFQYH
ncbi:MAG: hypothetical protein EP298_03565 [Gammaproteobacteria bacterium]|nr:MAG: hypothetical protein EP298_03565 [Gammaproteobacteria bacterium]